MTVKRRKNVPNPRMQFKLVITFVALGVGGLMLQYALSSFAIHSVLEQQIVLPKGLADQVFATLGEQMLISGALFIACCLSLGLLVSFRIAGPAYRMQQHLKKISEGGPVTPCHLRAGDELQFLCDALNEALESLDQGQKATQGDCAVAETVEQ